MVADKCITGYKIGSYSTIHFLQNSKILHYYKLKFTATTKNLPYGTVMQNMALVKSGPPGPFLVAKSGPPMPLLVAKSGLP